MPLMQLREWWAPVLRALNREVGELGIMYCFDAATDCDYKHVTLLPVPFFPLV